jgi:hypothetical protein
MSNRTLLIEGFRVPGQSVGPFAQLTTPIFHPPTGAGPLNPHAAAHHHTAPAERPTGFHASDVKWRSAAIAISKE